MLRVSTEGVPFAAHEDGGMERPSHETPRCARCGEVIGVYEPLLVLPERGLPFQTSLAATPDARLRGELLHQYCAAYPAGRGR